MTIHVEVISQEKRVFEELAADMVVIPAREGIMGVPSASRRRLRGE